MMFLCFSRSYAIFTVSMVQKRIVGATCGGGATEDQTSAMQKEGANTTEKLLLSYYDKPLNWKNKSAYRTRVTQKREGIKESQVYTLVKLSKDICNVALVTKARVYEYGNGIKYASSLQLHSDCMLTGYGSVKDVVNRKVT
ncbi:hypothetical protein Tco_0882433 [Tanacetum coccineum]